MNHLVVVRGFLRISSIVGSESLVVFRIPIIESALEKYL